MLRSGFIIGLIRLFVRLCISFDVIRLKLIVRDRRQLIRSASNPLNKFFGPPGLGDHSKDRSRAPHIPIRHADIGFIGPITFSKVDSKLPARIELPPALLGDIVKYSLPKLHPALRGFLSMSLFIRTEARGLIHSAFF